MKRHVLLLAAAPALAAVVSCNNEVTGLEPPSDPTKETFAPALGVDLTQMTLRDGIWYRDIAVGTGAEVTADTDSVFATFAVHLKDGKLADSGTNVKFDLKGIVPLITGFRSGLNGMKEGGKRKLVIPSALGYGGQSRRNADGTVNIPRQSTLIFDIDLLRVHNPPPPETPTP
jgi:peptidylprolyl isomerase